MRTIRIHITGASGAGTTTLGRALADAFSVTHHETDDYFWRPTVPPYQVIRDAPERLRLMHEMFLPGAMWILSGSLQGWGDPIIPYFDAVVFLYTAKEMRLQRLRARETARFGAEAVAAGGWRHRATEDFLEWASKYDEGESVSRTLSKHRSWLSTLSCPVFHLDGSASTKELVARFVEAFESNSQG